MDHFFTVPNFRCAVLSLDLARDRRLEKYFFSDWCSLGFICELSVSFSAIQQRGSTDLACRNALHMG